MNFFWYHDRIIQQYLRAKFKNPIMTEHQFGDISYQKLHQINCCFSSRPWGMLHDISNHVPHPFNIVTKNPYCYSKQNKNFGEICMETAVKIANTTDRPIAVTWSGGIDSTAALVALMQTVELNRITVVCNNNSIDEFPSFYKNKIENRVNVISLTELSDRYGDFFTVSGDGGDTVWAVIDESFWKNNQHKIHLPWQDCIDRTIIDDIDFVENFCSWSGVEIKSWLHLRTWFYLCCKWQDKCMRPYALRQDVTDKDTVAFYDLDTAFQNWTMNNLDKIIGTTWQDYKIPAKEFIHQYHQDSDYLQNKSKVNSFSIDLDLDSKYQTHTRIAVSEHFLGPRLPSWPFIDYADIEDFNDQDGLIPRSIIT
jgi:hypothetical protein